MNTKKMAGLATIAMVFAFTQQAHAALIASYSFEGNANDTSGNGHNLTVSGATATTGRFGAPSSAYAFNGNTDKISGPFTLPGNATFSIWASWTGNQYDMLFNTGVPYQGPDLFFYNNTISWNTWDDIHNTFSAIPANASNGEFHNYIVVVNNADSNAKLYFDGNLLGTASYRAPNNILTLGGAGGWGSGYWGWHGSIDDVAIYDTAFSSQEVGNLYKSTSSPAVPVPAAIWLLGSGVAGLAGIRLKRKKA